MNASFDVEPEFVATEAWRQPNPCCPLLDQTVDHDVPSKICSSAVPMAEPYMLYWKVRLVTVSPAATFFVRSKVL